MTRVAVVGQPGGRWRKVASACAGAVATFSACCWTIDSPAQVLRQGKVSVIQAQAAGDCTYFMLEGVPVADPVQPGFPWFGVARSAPGYKDMMAILYIARATSAPVQVQTTGQIICGSMPGVAYIGY
jgi:hypothetical protein